jgi:hypothetical protein
MDWIPSTILALGVAIPSIIGAFLSIKASNRAEATAGKANAHAIEANDNALKARRQSEETHVAINSRMDEMLKLTRTEAEAKATLAEKDAELSRQNAVTAAKEGVPDTVIELARVQAKALLDEAAVKAAKLLFDAKYDRQSLTGPIQVELSRGAGIDEPLKVIDEKKKP